MGKSKIKISEMLEPANLLQEIMIQKILKR